MYDRLAAKHEAAHAVVGAALGMRNFVRVKEDGSGMAHWEPGALDGLHPFDRCVLAVSGNVAEAMAIDGNLKRAVQDTIRLDSNDSVILRMALHDLKSETWKYGQQGPALAAAAKAREVIMQNRAEFNRLTDTLQRDGIGQVRISGGTSAASRPAARGVDYTDNLPALRGQAAGLPELRSLASKAASDGNAKLARLIEQTLARREGRAVEPVIEFGYGRPAMVR